MFSRIPVALLLMVANACAPSKKEMHYVDDATTQLPPEEVRPDFTDPGDRMPFQPTPAPRAFGQEPDKLLIAAEYRQDNNNTVTMDVDQTLKATFTNFSLPVIPKGGTQRLVPVFPLSWVWNATKDQYETVGRTTRPDGSLENVTLTAKTYPNFDYLDISMTIMVRAGDQISSTLNLLNDQATKAVADIEAGISFSRRSDRDCGRDRDRDCDRDHDHDHDDDDDHDRGDCDYPTPRPRPCPYPQPEPPQPPYPQPPYPQPCPPDYPTCNPYPDNVCDNTCPDDPDCRPRPPVCNPYPDGRCDSSCPNDPDCKPPCNPYPDGRCDGSCPNDPDCKPQCPKPDCSQCCCDCTGGAQNQEKTFVYKFKKID